MAIELTPVFFKLMLIKSPYDYLAENRDEPIKAEKGMRLSMIIIQINKELKDIL